MKFQASSSSPKLVHFKLQNKLTNWLQRSCPLVASVRESFDLQRDFIVDRHARVKRDSKSNMRAPNIVEWTKGINRRYEGVIVLCVDKDRV